MHALKCNRSLSAIRFTKFSKITRVMAITPFKVIQGHRCWYQSKAHIRLPISDYLLSCTDYELWLIIGQIFASESGVSHFIALAGVTPANITINGISLKTRFCGLHFPCRKYRRIFNHFYVIRPEIYRIRWNYTAVRAITPFKVIQGHRIWYQSKAHMRLPISD